MIKTKKKSKKKIILFENQSGIFVIPKKQNF